jgi:hypothetical protein
MRHYTLLKGTQAPETVSIGDSLTFEVVKPMHGSYPGVNENGDTHLLFETVTGTVTAIEPWAFADKVHVQVI